MEIENEMIEIRYGAENIDDFIKKLENYILDPVFEQYGNFLIKAPKFSKSKELTEKYKNSWHLFGNFYDYSNAFSIFIDENETVEKLKACINQNKKTEKYISAKKDYEERECAYKEYLKRFAEKKIAC